MNVNKVITKDYENKSNWTLGENEPKTNPIKANQTQFPRPTRRNKPNTNPIKANFKLVHLLIDRMKLIKGDAAEPDKDWKYVSLEKLDKLLDACPNIGWKMLIALCRLAGLRRGEALGWS